MASSVIKARPTEIYIASKITYKLSDGDSYVNAFYDPITRTVTGSIQVRNASAFTQNDNMFEIDEAYRPATNYGIPMMVKSGGNWYSYHGQFRSDGGIRQSLSSTATDVYGSFHYSLVHRTS